MAGGIRISSGEQSSRKTPAAPVAGKGKAVVQLTKAEQDSINRWKAKAEKKAAIEARVNADNKALAKVSGAGSSRTARSERDTAPLLALEWKAKSRPATSSTPTSPKRIEAGPTPFKEVEMTTPSRPGSPKRIEAGPTPFKEVEMTTPSRPGSPKRIEAGPTPFKEVEMTTPSRSGSPKRLEADTTPLRALEIKGKSRPPTSSAPTSPKRLEAGLPPEGPRASLSKRFGSFMKSVKEYMDFPPPNNDPIIEEFEEMKKIGKRSLFNGFKLMTPYQQDAIQQTKSTFPRNIHDPKDPTRRDQHAVVFHERGEEKLVPGPIKVGKNGEEPEPKGVSNRTARIKVHSRTYSPGSRTNFEPSMSDQIKARQNPNVDHIMQAPSLRGEENQYFIYTGKFPPRHYRLLPNPDNLPVPPNSPDGRMSAFRQRPDALGDTPSIPWTRNALE